MCVHLRHRCGRQVPLDLTENVHPTGDPTESWVRVRIGVCWVAVRGHTNDRNRVLHDLFTGDLGFEFGFPSEFVPERVVAGIETVWSGQVAPPRREARQIDYCALPPPVKLERGAEMGRFKLGSTVILLFPAGACNWENKLEANSPVRLGELLANATASSPSA